MTNDVIKVNSNLKDSLINPEIKEAIKNDILSYQVKRKEKQSYKNYIEEYNAKNHEENLVKQKLLIELKKTKYTLKPIKYLSTLTYRSMKGIKNIKNPKQLSQKIGIEGISLTTGVLKDVKTESMSFSKNFEQSEDLGLKTVTSLKHTLIKSKNAYRNTKIVGKAIFKGGKLLVKGITKIIANSVALKVIAIAGLILLLLNIFSSIIMTSIIPFLFNIKSSSVEVSKAYEYITELDIDKLIQASNIEEEDISQTTYLLNQQIVEKEELYLKTDAENILIFLDTKYYDYFFDSLIGGIFGTNVKAEIKGIHDNLVKVSHQVIEESEEYEDFYKDPITNQIKRGTFTRTIRNLEVRNQNLSLTIMRKIKRNS